MGLNFLEISGQDLTIAQTGNPAKVEMLVNPIVQTAGSGGEVNPDLISQAEAEAGTATTERVISAERLAQAITALASSSPEILDTLFRIVDSISGYKQIFDTSELTADRTETKANFDVNWNDYFDSDGTVIKLGNNVTLDNSASNVLDIKLGSSVWHSFNSSIAWQLNSTTKLGWCTGKGDTTLDTYAERIASGVIGFNGTIDLSNADSYDDDTAAGVGGVATGSAYITTGSGASPLNVAGIVMVKQ